MTHQIITIQGLSKKGYGTATLDNLELEVAHTVVGDEVEVFWKKKRYAPQKGRLLQVLKKSEDRTDPLCSHATICGGCCWQQMDYQSQVQEKTRRLKALFTHPIAPMISAHALVHYRNKMEFTFSENRGGEKFLGLMIAQAEPFVFQVKECLAGPRWFAEAVQVVRSWWEKEDLRAYDGKKDTGLLRYLTLRHAYGTDQKMVVLNVSGRSEYAPPKAALERLVFSLEEAFGSLSIFLRIHQTKKGTPTQFFEMHLSGKDHIIETLEVGGKTFSFKVSPTSFFQPNTKQAEKLYQAIFEQIPEGANVLDLYCGAATIGIAISSKASRVLGVELSKEAVLDAKENLAQVSNVEILEGDVGKVLKEKKISGVDVVILDPPRAGLAPLAMEHLRAIKAKKIIYVSCNPVTQARDIALLEEEGYQLDLLQPVDQFPHTYHIENMAVLSC